MAWKYAQVYWMHLVGKIEMATSSTIAYAGDKINQSAA